MKTTIFNLLAGILISGTILTGCSKENTINDLNNNGQQVAKQNEELHAGISILNQNLAIIYAKDGNADITQQFRDFTFRFVGNYPGGQAQVWNDLLAKTGTWSGREGSPDFTIAYPTDPFTQLAFLNRPWTMGESSSAVVRLIAADGDEVHFGSK